MEDLKQFEPLWGNWYIAENIGEGSFGKVYKIERKEYNNTYVAAMKHIRVPQSQSEVKIIKADGMTEKDVQVYFEGLVEDIVKEIVLMSKLKGNSNIVSYEDHMVIKAEESLEWNIFVRMELLTSLTDYIQQNKLTKRNVIKLGIDICKALELCQKHNIIHRDIKPENIFVSENGDFKLGDFGIARQIEKTVTGLSKKGTSTYIAPEVYKGEAYGSTVDIYSLGIVMYRLLNNNRVPFMPPYPEAISHTDREIALIKRISGQPIEKPVNADGRLAEIVLKACAYDPKNRYDSPVLMRMALESILYEESEVSTIYPEGDSAEIRSIDYIGTDQETTVTMRSTKLDLEKADTQLMTQINYDTVAPQETREESNKSYEPVTSQGTREEFNKSYEPIASQETKEEFNKKYEPISPQETKEEFNKSYEPIASQKIKEEFNGNTDTNRTGKRKTLKTGIAVLVVVVIAAFGLKGYSSHRNNNQSKIEEAYADIIKESEPHPYVLFDIDGDSIEELIIDGEYQFGDCSYVYRYTSDGAELLDAIAVDIEKDTLFRCNYNGLIGLGEIINDGEDSESYHCWSITSSNEISLYDIAYRLPGYCNVNVADYTKSKDVSDKWVKYSEEDFEKLVTELTSGIIDVHKSEDPLISAAIKDNIVPENLQENYFDDITREELCQLLMYTYCQKESKEIDTNTTTPFEDVDDPYVTAAYNLGVISAAEDNKFNPDGYVTRQEAAVILLALAKVMGVNTTSVNTNTYIDEDHFASWAKDAIYTVTALKSKDGYIMSETEDGKFSPWKALERREAISSLWKLYNCE